MTIKDELISFVVDYDGREMSDLEEPLSGVSCGLLRRAAQAIDYAEGGLSAMQEEIEWVEREREILESFLLRAAVELDVAARYIGNENMRNYAMNRANYFREEVYKNKEKRSRITMRKTVDAHARAALSEAS